MAIYPIKMLKDEGNNPFVPLVGTNAIVDPQGQSLDDKFATKLEATNIIAGENITLQKVGNNITINGGAGSSVSLIDNLTTDSPGLGALDARQGKVLKDLIPAVINNLNSTSTTSALSAYQGYLLKNRVVPAGGTTGQVLKKSSNADNAVEWGDNITVENNLTSTSTTNALSAAQGKILNDKIPSVINNLTSTSTTAALSAAQGKVLNDKLANFNVRSFGTSGYQKLPGGLLLQWTTGSVNWTDATQKRVEVSFPTTFPNACLNVQVTPFDTGPGQDLMFFSTGAYQITTSSVNVLCKTTGSYYSSSVNFYVLAIGY